MNRAYKKIICSFIVTSFVTILMITLGKITMSPGDVLGYVVITYFIVFPANAVVCGVLAGTSDHKIKWLLPLFTGMAALVTNLIVSYNGQAFISYLLVFTVELISAVIGIFIGMFFSKMRKQHITKE